MLDKIIQSKFFIKQKLLIENEHVLLNNEKVLLSNIS